MKNEELLEKRRNLPKIIFNNFGPVNNGEISLKPLTILFGENNTGKTHVGYALWEFFQKNSSLQYPDSLDGWTTLENIIKKELIPEIKQIINSDSKEDITLNKKIILDKSSRLKLSKKSIDYLFNYEYEENLADIFLPCEELELSIEFPYKEIQKTMEEIDNAGSVDEVANEFKRFINLLKENKHNPDYQAKFSEEVEKSKILSKIIPRFFELSVNTAIKDFNVEPTVSEYEPTCDGHCSIKYIYAIENEGKKLKINIKMLPPELNYINNTDPQLEGISKAICQKLYLAILSEFKDSINSCHYIPAPKAGLSLLYKLAYSTSLKQYFSIDPKSQKEPDLKLPTPMIEYLHLLNNIPSKESEDFKKTVQFLENNLLGGKIVKLDNDEVLYKSNTMDNFIPMSISSSLVVDSMPLITFLKYGILKENSLLILEEPESHLHPQAQRILGRSIVKLINSGLNIVLITHSPYILQQINNNIKLYFMTKKGKDKELNDFLNRHCWDKSEDILDPKDIVAYLFEKSECGSIIKKLEIYNDEGISSETFVKPLEELYQETAELRDILWGDE